MYHFSINRASLCMLPNYAAWPWVHGLSQAIQKRGLPRALLTDNGAAMVAEEVTQGLLHLGVVHERTLPYSPYQKRPGIIHPKSQLAELSPTG